MDIQKSETLQLPGTPPDGQYSTVEVEVGGEQSVEPSVARKQNRKKRAASGEPEREEGDPTPVTKDKSRTKKRNLELGRGTKSENESLVKLDDASDDVGGEATTLTSTKKRKPPKSSSSQKGNWTKEEDRIILHLKREGKGWQEITDLVRAAGSSESDRTLTAVRLRYQKVLKDRDVELSAEELSFLQQARIDIETTDHKYRYIADRYKELSGGKELSKGLAKKILAPTKKGEFNAMKGGGESPKN